MGFSTLAYLSCVYKNANHWISLTNRYATSVLVFRAKLESTDLWDRPTPNWSWRMCHLHLFFLVIILLSSLIMHPCNDAKFHSSLGF